VNKTIVQAINNQGGKAVGLSGKDANLLQCKQADKSLGMVGEPFCVNADVIHSLIENDFIPVIAPLGTGEDGETYNVNGDTAAGAIAGGLKADRLLLLTDVDGVKDKEGDVLTNLTANQVNTMTKNNVIVGGMIPKTQTALDAISDGVRAVVIMDGRVPNACLLELFTDHGAGSMIRA
jgi:acetylglutamate kinase